MSTALTSISQLAHHRPAPTHHGEHVIMSPPAELSAVLQVDPCNQKMRVFTTTVINGKLCCFSWKWYGDAVFSKMCRDFPEATMEGSFIRDWKQFPEACFKHQGSKPH